MTIVYIALAVLMFGVMITVHEAGHFFAARIVRIPVREFAIGFGPSLFSWNSKKHETKFHLRLIPVGGYCAFYAEDDIHADAAKDARAFQNYSPLKRLFAVLMGPVMNVVLAFAVAFALFLVNGVPEMGKEFTVLVQEVDKGSPAELAGFQSGDTILSVNGMPISSEFSETLSAALSNDSNVRVNLEIMRLVEGVQKKMILEAQPLYSKNAGKYLLGFTISYVSNQPTVWHKGDLGLTLKASAETCLRAGRSIIDAFGNLVFKGRGVNDISGIVGVTKVIVQETQKYRLEGYLSIMIAISMNLAIINLLPFPGLDGSRALFLIVEAFRKKPIKKEAYIHIAGMIILFALMILITFRDVVRLF